jgi:hypothetical protein
VGVAYWPRCRAWRFSRLHCGSRSIVGVAPLWESLHCGSGLSATMSGWEIHQGIAPGRALPQVRPSGLRARHTLHRGRGLLATMSGREIHQGIAPGRALPQVGLSHMSGAQTKQRLNSWAQAVLWEWPIGHDAELGASRGDAAGRPSPSPAAAYAPAVGLRNS